MDTGRGPQTPHEWTVHVLNIHGTFFERWVEARVQKAPPPWCIKATQFAVEFPPPEGPVRGHESVLDVWAEFRSGATWLSLLVECKKNDPDFSDWVLFEAPAAIDQRVPEVAVTALQIREKVVLSPDPTVSIEKRLPQSLAPIVDEAHETRGTWEAKKKKKLTKTSKAAIEVASHQVALAAQAIINEQWNLVRKGLQSDQRVHILNQWNWHAFLPAIVTTANLRLAKFAPEKVDAKSGTIAASDVSLDDVAWAWYLYPVPRHLQFGAYEMLALHRDRLIDFVAKMPIAIVNSRHLDTFLTEITSGLPWKLP